MTSILRRAAPTGLLVGLLTLLVVFVTGLEQARSWQIPKTSGPTCASITPDAWSTSYFFGAGGGSPYITLTNSNFTAQTASPGNNDTIIEIGTRCHLTGDFYWELNPVISLGGDGHIWGLAASTHGNRDPLGSGVTDSIGYSDFAGGRGWRYAGFITPNTMTQPTTGQTLGFAVKLNNAGTGSICVRNVTVSPTTWYGTSNTCDPAAGTGMFTFTSFSVPMYIAFDSAQNGSPNTGGTICTKSSCFAAAAPVAYPAWDTNP